MRTVFLGSPKEVIPILQELATNSDLVAVVSQPARSVGRSRVLQDPPVAEFAKTLNITTLQPESARDIEFQKKLQSLQPDVCVTAAYGQILDERFLSIPRRATINVHPSKLPQWRGATPIPSVLLAGAKKTAITILFTVKKLDAGPIILQQDVDIGDEETAGALTLRLFRESAPLVKKSLHLLENPEFKGVMQDETLATYCSKIDKTDGAINWSQSANVIYNRFRAFDPWPGSFTHFRGQRIIITNMRPDQRQSELGAEGEFDFDEGAGHLIVNSGRGSIAISMLKKSGSQEVSAAAFWNGVRERRGCKFESS